MRNLRIQLLFSHLTLVALMFAVMIGAVASFLRLGRSIDRILKDNYRSVVAAQDMKEALERIDSAAAFHLAGHPDRAQLQVRAYRPKFEAAYRIEAGNITEPGEHEMARDLGRRWERYSADVGRFLAEPKSLRQRAFYFDVLHPEFQALKARAQDIEDLNQAAILRADRRAKSEARHASRVAIGVTAVTLALALFFALRMVGTSLAPLRTLSRQAEEIGAGHLNQRIELHRTDEIGTLAVSFNRMAERLKEARRIEEDRLHRAERMSDEALESLFDPVIVTDAAGCVVHLNRAAEGLFGPASAATGRPVARVVEEHVAAAIDCVLRQEGASADEGEADYVALPDDETERTYRLRTTPMHDNDGGLLGAVAVLEDVTHLRHLDRLKTEFVSVASHELRTPVTSLLLSVQLMQEGGAGPLSPAQQEIVAAQREDLARLDQIMRDLLDLSRLEAGVVPPRFEIVPVRELVEDAVAAVTPKAEAGGLTIQHGEVGDVVAVRADRAQITRVLVNLLDNAVRYSPPGRDIILKTKREGEDVAFSVSDSGTGIPADYLERIFDRFVQVPGSSRGGSGLGLSIAQTIVKAHGGAITAESTLGKGSTFLFHLPAADRPDGHEGEA
jgi:PAS domain S-box-containing protein